MPGPWIDVLRFNLPSAVIALLVYSAAAVMALIAGYRGLRIVEALSLIAVPFLFNVLIVVGADWHMAELGAAVTLHAALPFPVQVAIGRAITLWLLGEAMLALIVAVSLNRPPRSLRVMALFALSGAFAAVTPLIANAAQLVTQPLLAIVVFQPLRGAGAGRIVGDRLSDDRRRARLAGGAAAALGRGLGPLAHRRGEGRDLRGLVHRLHPDRRLRPAHPGRAGVSQRLRARRRARCSGRRSFRSP